MDKLGDNLDIGHVGRLSAKCLSFSQYAMMAIDKLGLQVVVRTCVVVLYSLILFIAFCLA